MLFDGVLIQQDGACKLILFGDILIYHDDDCRLFGDILIYHDDDCRLFGDILIYPNL